jgi:hypothetical protein
MNASAEIVSLADFRERPRRAAGDHASRRLHTHRPAELFEAHTLTPREEDHRRLMLKHLVASVRAVGAPQDATRT